MKRVLGNLDPKPPSNFELGDLHRRIKAKWHAHRTLDGLARRDLRRLPWVLFYPPGGNQATWLGADRDVVASYRDWLRGGRRTRVAVALLHEFIRVHPVGMDSFDALRRLVVDLIRGAPSPAPPSMAKWQARCASYWLLESHGSRRFAADLVGRESSTFEGPPAEILAEAGFDSGLSRCGFLRSGILSVLTNDRQLVTGDRDRGPRLQRLLDLLVIDGDLRFADPEVRSRVAQALLGPFVDKPPRADVKRTLQSFFLKHYGHPALPAGWSNWFGVQDDAKRVMMRWLVREGMESFIRLVRESAYDQHWRYREAFWRACLEDDLIDDIWFVLGPRAKMMLDRVRSDDDATVTAQLAGALSEQSVLLMRLPGVTVAEWSHSGSCHLWLDGHAGAPRMYESRYHATRLRRSFPYRPSDEAHSQRHDGAAHGTWQDAIAGWLRANTGISLDRDRYFPRRLRIHEHDTYWRDWGASRGIDW